MKESVRACSRLAVVMAAVVWVSMFACRPSWSPDGKKLLFIGADQHGRFVGVFDRETGAARRVLNYPREYRQLNAMWTADGESIATISYRPRSPATVTVSDADGNVSGSFRYSESDGTAKSLAGCVPHGKCLFCTAGTIKRVDLSTGEVKGFAPTLKGSYGVGRRGDGLCYTRMVRVNADLTEWEIGALDPESLERTPILKSSDFPDLEVLPTPAFSPDLDRIAMPTKDRDAILVFKGGKLQATLPLGKREVVSDLTWSNDGRSIYAAQGSDMGTDHVWNLLEVTVDGGKQMRTPLFKCARWRFGSPVDTMLGIAVSPDGDLVAVSTACSKAVENADQGLYLVDLTAAERKAKRIAFPPAETIRVRGSDLMLGLGNQWREDYRTEPVDRVLEIGGGGTGAGFAALAAGKCDLSMATRRPRERDLEVAKKQGVEFVEHCIAREPLAICVHMDNPVASLTVAELANIFGQGSVAKWSDLGVEMPKGRGAVSVGFATGYRNARNNFRRTVLDWQKLDDAVKVMAKAEDAITMLLHEPNAIVCLDHIELARGESNVRIVPIRKDEDSPPHWPEGGSIDNGTYPLLSEFYVFTRKDAEPGVQRFLQWLGSKAGRASIDQAGYTPANSVEGR